MKKVEIKDLLKKEILIIELPRVCDYHLYEDMLYVFDNENDKNYRFRGIYTLLGKPDEINEDDARELADRIGEGNPSYQGDWFVNYQDDEAMFETATESLLSAIGTKIYWSNPLGKKKDFEKEYKGHLMFFANHIEKWHEAQSRTFDRSRSIILVKN